MARVRKAKQNRSSDIEVIIAIGVIIFIFALVGLMNGSTIKEFYKVPSIQTAAQTESARENVVGNSIEARGSVVALKPAVSDFQVAP